MFVKFSVVILFVALVMIPSLQQSFAYNTTYEVWDQKIEGSPLVCATEPETNEYLSENFIKLLMKETQVAVSEWEVHLKQTENKNHKHIWEINYTMITVEEQATYPYDNCDVFISFEEKPPDQNDWYKRIGITQYEVGDTGRSNIIIYYRAVEFCKTEDEKFYYYDPCYSEEPRLVRQLGSIIRHEFGHALGLGHFLADDLGVNVSWARGTAPSPSIMAKFTHQNTRENRIQTIDIKTVRDLYGGNGFLPDSEIAERTYIESLQTTKPQFIIPKGGFEVATIWGFLNDTTNVVGVPVLINITKPDGTIEQLISRPSEDNKFQTQIIIDKQVQEGTYLVSATYLNGKSQVMTFDVVSAENALPSNQTSSEIPPWIKNDVRWWVEGAISDRDFILGVQHLISIGVLNPPAPENEIEDAAPLKVPKWVKTTAKWWVEDKISDDEFKNAMRYLVKKGFMII